MLDFRIDQMAGSYLLPLLVRLLPDIQKIFAALLYPIHRLRME